MSGDGILGIEEHGCTKRLFRFLELAIMEEREPVPELVMDLVGESRPFTGSRRLSLDRDREGVELRDGTIVPAGGGIQPAIHGPELGDERDLYEEKPANGERQHQETVASQFTKVHFQAPYLGVGNPKIVGIASCG